MMNKIIAMLFTMAAASIITAAQSSAPSSPGAAPATNQTPAQAKPTPVVPHTTLKVGQAAPDFTLPSTIATPDGRGVVRYKLSDFKGKKNVVLAFYVLAFTGG